MRNELICIVLLLVGLIETQAQIGGRHAFTTVSLPTNARTTALAGSLISVKDSDVALAQLNPAVCDSLMHQELSINENFHYAGIINGNIAYGRYLKKWGLSSHIALQHVNYGDFNQTDAFGNVTGEFSAREVGLTIGASKQLNERIRGGVNFKFLTASYETYRATGLGVDIGFYYQKSDTTANWGLVLRNIGSEIEPLVETTRGLPFDIQLGVSKRLRHLPFRFSIIGHHLQNWYIRYDDPETDIQTSIFGEVDEKSALSKNVDNFFRHFYFNGEFLIGKREQFRLRFGYDHLRRQEMKLSTFRSLAGFSFGIGFNIKKIKIDYGRGIYHIAGPVHQVSLRYNLDRIFSKI